MDKRGDRRLKNAIWPGWKTVQKVGSGSFGEVYEIERDVFGETEKAALKVIKIPQNSNDVEELRSEGYDDASITAHFQSYLKNIVHEYSIMTKIKGHSNLVYCDDIQYVQNEDGVGWTIYIKMELLTPLMKTLQNLNSEAEVLRLGKDICRALIRCQLAKIVHRDIKPQNIFVSKDGVYKLGDFGIAKTVEKTTGGTKIGTYRYMAPEVYRCQPYGASADLYSLGLVLYWLLNEHRTPFLPLPPEIPTARMEEESRRRRFDGEPLPPPKHGSEEFKQIVLKACAFAPSDRYSSAEEMLRALEKLVPSMCDFTQAGSSGGEKTSSYVVPTFQSAESLAEPDTASARNSSVNSENPAANSLQGFFHVAGNLPK